ncbi:sigma factor, partial [Neomoorella thermoacetica]|uniref:sigma factor n=1 Tax=Neomoorella thermoacetica TaxID=1525 RepID=UPI0023ECA7EF
TGEDTEDLISIGTVGLIKAINTYNKAKGTKLATYAARCIENDILITKTGRVTQSNKVSNPVSGRIFLFMGGICLQEGLIICQPLARMGVKAGERHVGGSVKRNRGNKRAAEQVGIPGIFLSSTEDRQAGRETVQGD